MTTHDQILAEAHTAVESCSEDDFIAEALHSPNQLETEVRAKYIVLALREEIDKRDDDLTEREFLTDDMRNQITGGIAEALGGRDGAGSPSSCPFHIGESGLPSTDDREAALDASRAILALSPPDSSIAPADLRIYEHAFNRAALPTIACANDEAQVIMRSAV